MRKQQRCSLDVLINRSDDNDDRPRGERNRSFYGLFFPTKPDTLGSSGALFLPPNSGPTNFLPRPLTVTQSHNMESISYIHEKLSNKFRRFQFMSHKLKNPDVGLAWAQNAQHTY